MMPSESGVLEYSQDEAPEKDTLSLPGLIPFSREDCEPEPKGWCTLVYYVSKRQMSVVQWSLVQNK